MDIASVYRNFASLLGTEIEVEGYYVVPRSSQSSFARSIFLHEIEYEPDSEKLFIPPYVGSRALLGPMVMRELHTRVLLKGTLKQNAQSDPFFSDITSISYKTNNIFFQAIPTYGDDVITWRVSTDFVFEWAAYFQAQHRRIKDITLVDSILREPVVVEGYLRPYVQPQTHQQSHMLAVENIFHSPSELRQLREVSTLSDVVQDIFNARPFWDQTRYESPEPDVVDVDEYNKIWIPLKSQADQYLDLYVPEQPLSGWRSKKKDPRFTFAGTIDYLSEAERKTNDFTPDTRLGFTHIDYIAIRQTFTFPRSHDE